MKLSAMPCRVTEDRWVMVESSDKMWCAGEGNGKLLQYSCLENPMKSMKRQKDMTLKDELLRSNNREGTQPHPPTENWIKDLLSMALPIRTRPSFFLSLAHQEASISLLSLSLGGQTE